MVELLHARTAEVLITACLAASGLPLLLALRHALRERPRLAPRRRGLLTDLGFAVVSPITELVARLLTSYAIAGVAVLLGRELGPSLLEGFGPVARQPRWLIVLEMLLLGDLLYYWTHRMAHTVPLLWRFHAVHHSTTHMGWSSAMRAHPAEAYVHVLHLLPLFLLGFPVDALLPLTPLVTLYAMFIHSDLDFTLRPISFVCNSPVFHGWHHALDVSEGCANYAGWFPLYDALFGTYRLPQTGPQQVGIDDPLMPDHCLGQLLYPLGLYDQGGRQDELPARDQVGGFSPAASS